MRNLAELKAECVKNGINVLRSGKREAKADYEKALANFYWKRDHGDEPMPPQLHPMLARNFKDLTDAERDFMWQAPRWIAQEKIDGCRLLEFFGPMGNTFTSRRLSDRTYRYNENTDQIPHLSNMIIPELVGTVIDGEVKSPKAVVNTGKTTTLNELQATVAILALRPSEAIRVQEEQDCHLVFHVFDILQHKGKDVSRLSYSSRATLLSAEVIPTILAKYPDAKINLVPMIRENKRAYYEQIVAKGGEGIMIKDLEAPYEASSSRTKAMYKVKRFEELDLFVTGFAPGEPGAGWEKLVGGLEMSGYCETSNAIHPTAWVTNMTFEERCAATVCPQCSYPMVVQWRNVDGKRIVENVECVHGGHGQQTPSLEPTFMNRVYVVRGQEITARVLRLKHAVIVSSRDDKAPEDCRVPLAMWRAKFESKGDETGVQL